ncbi:hypothetical protein E2562_034446 [Oryza meyeriana var. granulata]|uniref:Uncharacterized protein n=1 Tax=Oryza meyeriana var. granulata TaxID=110450 RepID=A0A6G1CW84_9ORYZ|nr:hypothetical protein E2562_034446 [Oryza meyeriana var. granulata]
MSATGGAPIDPTIRGVIFALHSGQLSLVFIHSATHSLWKTWRHAGTSLHSLPRRSCSRQIAHTTDDVNSDAALPPPRGAYGKYGSCATSGAGGWA